MPYKVMRQDALPTQFVSQIKRFPWYDSAQYNDATKAMEIGTLWWQGTNAFMYVRADAGLTVGQLVAYTVPTEDTGAAGSTVAVQNLTTPATLTADADIGYWAYIEGGATLRKIKDNGTASITVSVRDQNSPVSYGTGAEVRAGAGMFDADQLAAAYTSGVVAVIRPGHVSVCDATHYPVGVALGTVTATYYTIVQVVGLALVSGTDAGTDVLKGVPATPGAAGVINGSASTTLYRGAGTIIPLEGLTGGASAIIPCNVNLLGNC